MLESDRATDWICGSLGDECALAQQARRNV